MNYYLKTGRFLILTPVWLLISLIGIYRSIHKEDYSSLWFWGITASIFAYWSVKYWYKKIFKKPVLIINNEYIFERFDNVKYYWTDVKEVVMTGNYLFIHLYKPWKYIFRINNPLKILIAITSLCIFKKISPFYISLYPIEIKSLDDLLIDLDEHSLATLK